MTLQTTLKAAQELGVSERYAVMKRISFLQPQIKELNRIIWICTKDLERNRNELEKALLAARIKDLEKDLRPLKRESESLLNHINGVKNENKNVITDDMIETARQYPITSIIDFMGRKTVCCPFHKDSNPSMTLYDNRVHCFVCNKTWDSLSATMELDGVSFRGAVLALQQK
jgi:hypothetical protein